MYKDAFREYGYRNAMRNLEDNYVPLDEFTAEQEKVEVCSKRESHGKNPPAVLNLSALASCRNGETNLGSNLEL